MAKRIAGIIAAVLVSCIGYFGLVYSNFFGELERPGALERAPRPETVNRSEDSVTASVAEALQVNDSKQILFGDLHVHSTYSIDAFQYSLSLFGGEGSHPPADACDFARYCSSLDFFAFADHAEQLTPQHWQDTIETVRQCNAVAGGPSQPDMVAFLGWEWTHAGTEPANHYGHKVVITREEGEGRVPTRPVYAKQPLRVERAPSAAQRLILPLLDFGDRQRVYDFNYLNDTVAALPECPENVDVRELPADCREGVATPRELFGKLDQWGFDFMVIPHGNAWGIYTPPGTTWDKQLRKGNQRSDYQYLIEAFSGHGSSEAHRPWRAVEYDASGRASCPEPSPSYTPACWRGGEIIRNRCQQDGAPEQECEERAALARQFYADNGIAGHNAIPGTRFEEWLNAGQCTDCFLPAFNYRPGGSAQYALSITNFDKPGEKQRFRFGLIASSDNHLARPGTGYKELHRYGMTETSGVQTEFGRKLTYPRSKPESKPQSGDFLKLPPPKRYEHERGSSFFYTGGLVAVHAHARNRDAIWDALQKKEVYGTSGERILLWFDLVNAPEGVLTMGSELEADWNPRFRVRAAGALEQKPGCPGSTTSSLSAGKIARICKGECYNPSNERKLITRIEVIRILPQAYPNEPISGDGENSRIQDPWRIFLCEPDPNGCEVTFSDDDFEDAQRDVVYYVRAIQEAGDFINAANLRCERDDAGSCIRVNPCYSDDRTDKDDQCSAREEGRAWSSPIFVDFRNG